PNGQADDLSDECARYSALLGTASRDVQILGLGSNGHIGFNEPNTPFDSKTHVVNLAKSTIKDNSRLFDDETQVPKKAITMGISEIMQAKKIIILASGSNKAR
ncbi:MAG: 6-phosphogluconolactonase, partial [Clostridia bacterium]|nr:6-phosphogluconolactonase [Clostridia bacterium]